MASADPADQQRAILRAFRAAVAARVSAEAAAEAQLNQARDAAQAQLASAKATADRQIETTVKAAAAQRDEECRQIENRFEQETDLAESQITEVRASVQALVAMDLREIGLPAWPDRPTAIPSDVLGAAPNEAFAQAVERVQSLVGDLRAKIELVRRERDARAQRRFRVRLAGVLLADVLLVLALMAHTTEAPDWWKVVFVGFPATIIIASCYLPWKSAQLYQSATTALATAQWDAARSSLQALIKLRGEYSEAQNLLRESYYRPAVAAIRSGQWALAAAELAQLGGSWSDYKDVQKLIAAYPDLRRALDARKS